MDSVLQREKECYACGTTYNLHSHHVIYGTSNRKNSERRGFKVWLCAYHHNMSNEGVHFNKSFDLALKTKAQAYYEEHYGSREDFAREFGRNFI